MIGVPTQETGEHIVLISQPIDQSPNRPSSPRTDISSDETSSNLSGSRSSRGSRSKRSLERELKALKLSSPKDNKQDRLKNWTKSGYYRSPYPGMLYSCPIEIIKGLTDKGQFQYLTKLKGSQEGTYLYTTQFISLR